jgi:hypothetical protein
MKDKIVVGNDPMLHNKLIVLYYDSVIKGYSGATMTTKRVENIFLLEQTTKTYEAICQGVSYILEEQNRKCVDSWPIATTAYSTSTFLRY